DLLTTVGWCRFHLDEPAASRSAFLDAADSSERAGDTGRMAAALLGIGSGRLLGTNWDVPPARLRACLARVSDTDSALRADLLSRLADQIGEDRAEAERLYREAMRLARRSGNVDAMVVAVGRFLLAFPFAEPLAQRSRLVEELTDAAASAGPEGFGYHTADVDAVHVRILVEEGRLDEALRVVAAYAELPEFSTGMISLRIVEPVNACISVLRGELDTGQAFVARWMDEAQRRGSASLLEPFMNAHLLTVLREQGQLDVALGFVKPLRAAEGAELEAVIALAHAEMGRRPEAIDAIDAMLTQDLARAAGSWGGTGMALLCLLAEACALVGHERGAAALEPLMAATADRNVVVGMPPISAFGWGSYFVALCALTLGRLREAHDGLTDALAHNEAMGARPAVIRCRFHLARVELARGDGEAALDHLRVGARLAERFELEGAGRLVAPLLARLGGGGGEPLEGTVTFVFTDIEDSTARTAALGDQAWNVALAVHTSAVRALVVQHDGRVVKGLGDGFMLAFPSARHGVECALAIQGATNDSTLRVRAGVHTGEAEVVDGDYFGHHVNLAARVSGAARAGEVLVSAVVHTIVASAGDLAFGEPRVVQLKGIPGNQVLYPVVRA
nr:adenylate/guanylate cyclase domain-containing protein [Actinomycetota bacterium]